MFIRTCVYTCVDKCVWTCAWTVCPGDVRRHVDRCMHWHGHLRCRTHTQAHGLRPRCHHRRKHDQHDASRSTHTRAHARAARHSLASAATPTPTLTPIVLRTHERRHTHTHACMRACVHACMHAGAGTSTHKAPEQFDDEFTPASEVSLR